MASRVNISSSDTNPRTTTPDEKRLIRALMQLSNTNTENLTLGLRDIKILGQTIKKDLDDIDGGFVTDTDHKKLNEYSLKSKRRAVEGLVDSTTAALVSGMDIINGVETIRGRKPISTPSTITKGVVTPGQSQIKLLGKNLKTGQDWTEIQELYTAYSTYQHLFVKGKPFTAKNLRDKTGKRFKEFINDHSKEGRLWGPGALKGRK